MSALFVPPPLSLIMVAPNGARRTKADHSALPMTIAETVVAAKACLEAGASALHAHVRDLTGAHVLDAGLYRELLSEMRVAVPQMQVQITTEAVGKYTPEEQRELVYKVKPDAVSVAIREMVPEGGEDQAKAFYHWAFDHECAVQHIVYSADDLDRFFDLAAAGTLAGESHQLLFVLGRYAAGQESAPEDLVPFLEKLAERGKGQSLDWAVCAFGHRETECLVEAVRRGGKARIGFENGLWNRTGERAIDNADRVSDLVSALKEHSLMPA
ncbi:MAG: 3-keto-5-aminohexanoate cleavage protein [Pseudomonadota bacterium]|nr:3-keto-5-aminohexanoate cleavage protein [Pseudomonadota bacterium]MEE2867554.1 3-keto-5-aminohexanoate cleavage protein [Pseudomonadota bacterium]